MTRRKLVSFLVGSFSLLSVQRDLSASDTKPISPLEAKMDLPQLPSPLLEKLCPASPEGSPETGPEEWNLSIYRNESGVGGYTAQRANERPDLWPLLVFDGAGKLIGRIIGSAKEEDRKAGTELLKSLSEKYPDREDHVLDAVTRRFADDEIVRQRPLNGRPSRDFAHRYPHPVLGEIGPSPVKGLTFFSVYDESHMARDPIVPTLWIRTPDGQMLETDRDGYRRALSQVRWTPVSSQEALAFARFYATAKKDLNHRHVYSGGKTPADLGINSPIDLEKIGAAPPSVEKTELAVRRPRGDTGIDRLLIPVWTVRLFVADVQPKAWGMRGYESIYRLTLKVGADVFEVDTETLWSDPPNASRLRIKRD